MVDADLDASDSDVDMRFADRAQLGAALFVLALLTVALGGVGSMSAVGASLQSPRPLAFGAVVAGVFLGGEVAVLTARWDRLRAAGRTVRFRAAGGAATFGTYLALLMLPALSRW